VRGLVCISALVVLAACPVSAAADAPTRYSLAGGCFALREASSGKLVGERLRMQATRLGSYLMYGPARDFLAADPAGGIGRSAQPSPAADWRVDPASGDSFTLTPASAPDKALAGRFTFEPSTGCVDYPEAELNARGEPWKGSTPFGEVGGFLDGHMHWMTFEYIGGNFHCGRPWSPYGIPYALPDCSEIEGPEGSAAPVQNTLNFGAPAAPHDTSGWPKLTAWGRDNVTYEGTYYRWLERAHLAGLNLIVMPINENRVLCELMTNRRNSCDEMTTVRKGLDDMNELQDYVDAQAGGPGKGFFQIVRDPFEARRAINAGKMAVVLEIEVSELFGCRGWDHPTCDQAQVDRELDEFYARGVRSSLLLNKFDNPLTGVRFDSGPVGALINAGNQQSAGSFWSAETCKGQEADNTIEGGVPEANSGLGAGIQALGVSPGTTPTYPPPPHCNTRGLTDLGRHLVERMMDKHMIVNPDHASQKAVDGMISLAEARRYSGVISPHGWMDPRNWPRIWALGGMAFPYAGSATQYVEAWKKYAPTDKSAFPLGWGWGADLGGLAQQGAPGPAGATAVTYPFRSYDGRVTFDRQRTGDRTFDYAREGVAHYGLYADWVEEVRKLGGDSIMRDMWRSSESYLEMWERAEGVPGPGCHPPPGAIGRRGLGALRLGASAETVLKQVGQPQQRTRAWTWCVGGAGNETRGLVAVFSREGRLELVGGDARGLKAGGVAVGARVPRGAKRVAGGLVRKRNALFTVRRGRVRHVAVVASSLVRDRARLREDAGLLRKAKARQPAAPAATPARLKIRQPVTFVQSTSAAHAGFTYVCPL
jgi:microsomal dipeptidase-like Zn-dependent dipeptidase